jgi:hypothetical protein
MNPRPEKNNMKFTNIKYQGKRVVRNSRNEYSCGCGQYPKAEDAPGDKVSYSLLMSFDGERSSRSSGFKQFLDTIQAQVLDMAQS